MSRWLLNHVPVLGLAVLVIGGFVAVAVVGVLLVRKRLPHWASGEDNDVAGVFLGVVGGVYGIVLAFVIVAMWEGYQDAERAVTTEATEVSQLYRDTRGLAPETAEGIKTSIRHYLHHVVEHEWPAMKEGRDDPDAWAAVEEMYAVLRKANPTTVAQQTFYSESVGKVNDVVAARRERLHIAAHELPGTLQILLVGGALVIIGFMFLFGSRNPKSHLVMVVAVATLLAFNLLLALLLDHPFSGTVSVSNAAFRQGALDRFFAP